MSKPWFLKAVAVLGALQARVCLALADGAAASAPALDFKRDVDPAMPGTPQWILAAVICVAALWIGVEILRRRGKVPSLGRRGVHRLLSVEERTLIAPGVHLVVARYGSRRLLLSAGPQGVQCLKDDEATDPSDLPGVAREEKP